MLTKEAVVEYAEEFLKLEGYHVNYADTSSDLTLFKDTQVLKVVAWGAVSDAGHTSKKGKGFNKNQIRTNLALALYDVSRQMTLDESHQNKSVIVIPDSKLYYKLAKEIEQVFSVLNIRVLLTSEMGLFRELSI